MKYFNGLDPDIQYQEPSEEEAEELQNAIDLEAEAVYEANKSEI